MKSPPIFKFVSVGTILCFAPSFVPISLITFSSSSDSVITFADVFLLKFFSSTCKSCSVPLALTTFNQIFSPSVVADWKTRSFTRHTFFSNRKFHSPSLQKYARIFFRRKQSLTCSFPVHILQTYLFPSTRRPL